LGVVERLDAERVAREDELSLLRVVERDRVHAAQGFGEAEAAEPPEKKRRLAIRARREADSRERLAELDMVVDLAVGDERGAARLVERLIARLEIDDREPLLDERDVAFRVAAGAVRAAMRERGPH